MNGLDIPSVRYRPSEASDQEIDQRACNFNTGDSRGHGAGTTGMERECQRQGTPKQGIISCKMPLAEVIEHLVEHGCPNVSDRLDLQLCGQIPMSSGGFGDVYQGTMRNGAQVALKCLRCYVNKGEVNQNALKHAAKELYAWSKCKHNNVVQLLGLAEFRGQITMVSPWMENGSVSRLDKSVSIDYRCTLSAQIAVGLSYIHSIGIVHGDLKGANVLLSDDGAAQLTDFGNAIPESRTLSFTGSSINSGLSIRWASPEQLQGEAIYSMQADVYSLAMTILEVISGKVPFMNIVQDMAVVAAIKARKTPARPEVISAHEDGNGLWGLLMRCWAWDPVERPVATTVSHVMTRITQGGACDSDSIHDTKQTLRCGSPNPPTPSHPEAAGVDVERMMMRQEALELKREDFNGYLASEGEKVSHIVNDISIQTLSNESIDQLPYLEVDHPQTHHATTILHYPYKLLNISYAATVTYFMGCVDSIANTIASRRNSSLDLTRFLHAIPLKLRQKIFLHLIELLADDVRYVGSSGKYQQELCQRIKTINQCYPEWNEITDTVWASKWATGVSLWTAGVRCRDVCIIIAEEEGLPLNIVLSSFRYLQTASLNLHSSFKYDRGSNSFQLLSWATELPPSLEHLEILFFHGPDSEIIGLVAWCCPNLVELRLVRCTMFNRPKCWYPASMAHTYMRSHNVTDATNYAVPMSSLVQRLPKLEILHLGDYHTNFSAVMIHRMNHQKYYPTRNQPNNFDPTVHTAGEDDDGPPVNDNVPPLAPRGPWDPHCPTCKQRFASKTEEAERRAVAVLATRVWSLRTISFASFFSDRCVGPSSWEIRRRGEDASGKLLSPEATQELGSGDAVSGQLRVETFRANNRRTIREEMFERREVGWSVVD